jgi:hypothetical protein
MTEGSPLYPLLEEINTAAKSGLCFLAVSMAVALPDICVSLTSENGNTTGKKYRAWCDENLPKDKFSFVTSGDLWQMRCKALHNGRFGDIDHNVARVIFALPNSNLTIANCQLGDAYVYGAVDFCKEFTQAVYKWFEANKNDDIIQSNLPRLIQYRPNGLSPYVVGVAVLA